MGPKDDDEAGWLSARARGPMLNDDDEKPVVYLIRKPAPSRRAKHKDGAGGAEAVAGYARVWRGLSIAAKRSKAELNCHWVGRLARRNGGLVTATVWLLQWLGVS
ncbi:uncharacterized protein TrAtP1_003695 [Trichoderma atroviride]|uniref:uncharacterized protein n=1 Tax=Hypocrea atroviridis TaxID=63577 RepID=UPI00332768BA|nr:hypothetical protein TrAtP1_003695 [Trichoderma atroviride]